MEKINLILCILGAFIGAGFASGREIMQFFTQYGILSHPLILLSGCFITGVMRKALCHGQTLLAPHGKRKKYFSVILLLLLLSAGGGMAAAAGELWALTVPLHHARSLGLIISLLSCLLAARRPVAMLSGLCYLMLPALILALMLCLRLPGDGFDTAFRPIAPERIIQAVLCTFSYAGMNVMLTLGVLSRAGKKCTRKQNCRSAAWAGGMMTALLLLFNQALLPHLSALRDAPLPLVKLLSAYGKEGYYLSAAVLYFAVITTLIAILRSLWELLSSLLPRFSYALAGLLTAAVSLLGFEEIVAVAYPILGLFCFIVLCRTGEKPVIRD